MTTGKDGTDRILLQSGTYTAEYRNGAGHVVNVATRCRSKDAALSMLTELQDRADKVRSGGWTVAEDAVLDHKDTPIADHIDAYLAYLRTKRGKGRRVRTSHHHVVNTTRCLKVIVAGCGFQRLRDLNREPAEKWGGRAEADGLAARTVNSHFAALSAFGNWCVETKRIIANPFTRLPMRDQRADRRKIRRALTGDELRRLLKVGRLRPVAEYGRKTVHTAEGVSRTDKRSRRTWKREPLSYHDIDAAAERGRAALAKRPDHLAKLEERGRGRALVYKALVLTGMRKGELAAVKVRHLELSGPQPYIVLDAADEKAGRGAEIPIRGDLAEDVREWLAERLEKLRAEARAEGRPVPAMLPADLPVFDVPDGLVRIMDRDLVACGIAKLVTDERGRVRIDKSDDRGRTVDVHALRHTFGTHLSKGGVAPRTAQAAMRHSTVDLTMNTYTDPRLLDVAGALDVLPSLPLADEPESERQRATGTTGRTESSGRVRGLDATADGRRTERQQTTPGRAEPGENGPTSLVPMLVPNSGKRCISGASTDKSMSLGLGERIAVSDLADKSYERQATPDNLRRAGFEPATFGSVVRL